MQDRFKFRLYDDIHREMIDLQEQDVNPYNISDIPQNNIMQCTGLKDKNGKLIYEGDILLSLATKSHIGVVCWDKEKAYFKINGKGIAYNALQTICSKNAFEVIGNIYENPELLEE